MASKKVVISATGTGTLIAAATGGKVHLNAAIICWASAYAAGVVDIFETTSGATSAATLYSFIATAGGNETACWGMDDGLVCSATSSRIAYSMTGNSCTGLVSLIYHTRG